jgi:hypothetical protein
MTESVQAAYLHGQIDALQEAIADIWKAHLVMVSNGMTMGTFKRHMEPAIYDAAKLLPEEMRRLGAPKIERTPAKDEWDELL